VRLSQLMSEIISGVSAWSIALDETDSSLATLVLYTNSSSGNEQDTEQSTEVFSLHRPTKKRKLPPLAAHLAPAVPLDDPSKHQGPTRAIPHVDGRVGRIRIRPYRVLGRSEKRRRAWIYHREKGGDNRSRARWSSPREDHPAS
jgi:hypothetical protein